MLPDDWKRQIEEMSGMVQRCSSSQETRYGDSQESQNELGHENPSQTQDEGSSTTEAPLPLLLDLSKTG